MPWTSYINVQKTRKLQEFEEKVHQLENKQAAVVLQECHSCYEGSNVLLAGLKCSSPRKDQEIAALNQRVGALVGQLGGLQGQVATLMFQVALLLWTGQQIDSLYQWIVALEMQMTALLLQPKDQTIADLNLRVGGLEGQVVTLMLQAAMLLQKDADIADLTQRVGALEGQVATLILQVTMLIQKDIKAQQPRGCTRRSSGHPDAATGDVDAQRPGDQRPVAGKWRTAAEGGGLGGPGRDPDQQVAMLMVRRSLRDNVLEGQVATLLLQPKDQTIDIADLNQLAVGLEGEVATLQVAMLLRKDQEIATLNQRVGALEGQVGGLQDQVANLMLQVAMLLIASEMYAMIHVTGEYPYVIPMKQLENRSALTIVPPMEHVVFTYSNRKIEGELMVEETDTSESASAELESGVQDAGMERLAQDLFGCNFQELADINQDLATNETEARDWEKDATLQELQRSGDNNKSGEED
uniref:Uncharacterized protein n=1 Tax=Branchiostoma floridae TaxID=7739 RepID=C3YU65_BRAFL|eukprot:XP_002600330.1 hypothetical protein BRAFLDRAFT_66563 [Branchiostoma floridae]